MYCENVKMVNPKPKPLLNNLLSSRINLVLFLFVVLLFCLCGETQNKVREKSEFSKLKIHRKLVLNNFRFNVVLLNVV